MTSINPFNFFSVFKGTVHHTGKSYLFLSTTFIKKLISFIVLAYALNLDLRGKEINEIERTSFHDLKSF